ncbi:hypothetical protein JAAARDRAFT_120420 [Jaapia argillacea MUCL 33604]|uniref:Plant basic secretory protein n=1 Tax=Jaapia argillacea MUCL 33604 TaxID=933084 RepID=A0A067QI21_9AGAM|nr:hypothetical protein JAAARDRAFT_120420 [Jaapia argillacea MUCL 33604]
MPPPPLPPNKPAPPTWPIPKFDLRVEDLEHPGAKLFFKHIDAPSVLRTAVTTVCSWLYTEATVPRKYSILLVLRPMDGVAYTHGSLTHKEIHFSLQHIENSASRAKDEITGVITHEMVHCYQYNGKGKCPGGLIEGMADWVRLHAGLSPPHWKRNPSGDKWDAGYQDTAYFLDWIEVKNGAGTVRALNEAMKDTEYTDDIFREWTGGAVGDLWKLYREELEGGKLPN